MARCKHNSGNIQQFTEVCLDCGHNIYETDEEYEKSLQRDIQHLQSELREKNIETLELKKEQLEKQLKELKGEDYDDRF